MVPWCHVAPPVMMQMQLAIVIIIIIATKKHGASTLQAPNKPQIANRKTRSLIKHQRKYRLST
jgi:hypothetical protein